MAEEKKEMKITKVSDMLRSTSQNTGQLMIHIAEHIDKLEAHVEKLERRILELESATDGTK